MIEDYFVDNIYEITSTRNEYGDFVSSGVIAHKGRFLDHVGVVLTDAKEVENTDAIAWLPKTVTIEEGKIIRCNNKNYRIIKRVTAKRGKQTATMFMKFYLQRHKAITGVS